MPAAADEFFRRIHGEDVGGADAIAGFAGGLAVHADGAGEDEAFGLFAAGAEGAFDESLIYPQRHGGSLNRLGAGDQWNRGWPSTFGGAWVGAVNFTGRSGA